MTIIDCELYTNAIQCLYKSTLNGRKLLSPPAVTIAGILFYTHFMIRTSFLIDGFNLYHSVKTASHDLGLSGGGTRWLDIRSMCQSYLHLIDTAARLSEIYYFSALAKHLEMRKPDVTLRHKNYIST